MPDDPKKRTPTPRQVALGAAIFGAAVALLCHFLPHDYQAACRVAASICSVGG